jgi:hypothetical protein
MAKSQFHLLRSAQRQILQHPEAFRAEETEYGIDAFVLKAAGVDPNTADIYRTAKQLLGISSSQAQTLFVGYQWQARFCRRYIPDASNRRELRHNARLAAARIEHFIRGGA